MADFWKHLFDSEWRQRDDIESAREEMASAQVGVEVLENALARAERRIDRLELTLEGLVTWLQTRAKLDPNELALLMARLDLADGHEDGAIRPERSANAPSCGKCGRPRNPKRAECLYCGAGGAELAAPAPARTGTCSECGKRVAESALVLEADGLVCVECHLAG